MGAMPDLDPCCGAIDRAARTPLAGVTTTRRRTSFIFVAAVVVHPHVTGCRPTVRCVEKSLKSLWNTHSACSGIQDWLGMGKLSVYNACALIPRSVIKRRAC